MKEQKLLSVMIKDRGMFRDISSLLSLRELSPQGEVIYSVIQDYYNADESARFVDIDVIEGKLARLVASPKQAEELVSILRSAKEEDTSGLNVIKEIKAVKKGSLYASLAQKLVGTTNDLQILEQMDSIKDMLEDDLELGDTTQQRASVRDLVTVFERDNLIHVAPNSLDMALGGGVVPGSNLLFFGVPEIGKSALSITAAAGFVARDLPTLYIGNEDPAVSMIIRLVSCMSGKTRAEILDDPDAAERLAKENGYDLLTFREMTPGTFPEIRRLTERLKPKVIIIDQLRNINVFTEHKVQALEKAAQEARAVAKKYGLVVLSVVQAGDSAFNKPILNIGDVYESNTGIPGAMDLMVGIGATESMMLGGTRMLSFPKNKISGYHGAFQVKLDQQLSKITTLEKPQVII